MKYLRSLIIASVIAVSVYGIVGCSNSTSTNTVYVHDTLVHHDMLPDWDDSLWILRNSNTSAGLVTMQFLDSNVGFAAGTNGAVIRTTDAGLTWTALSPAPTTGNSGGGNTCYGIWFFNKTNGIAVGDANGVIHTTDGGTTWYGTTINTSYFLRSIFFINPLTGFIGTSDPNTAGAAGEIWRTTDAGVTWGKVSSNNTGGIYSIRFGSSTNGVALGGFGTAYWTSDGGSSWHAGTSGFSDKQIIGCAFTSPTNAFASCIGSQFSGAIIHTTDAGVTWTPVRSTGYGCGAIAFNGSSVLTAMGYNGNVSESTDNGVTWRDDTAGGGRRWMAIAYPSQVRAVAAGEGGLVATRHRQY